MPDDDALDVEMRECATDLRAVGERLIVTVTCRHQTPILSHGLPTQRLIT